MTNRDLIEILVGHGRQRAEAVKMVKAFEAEVERRVLNTKERRETIAIHALQGLLAADYYIGQPVVAAETALMHADTLIAELDKP
jgi:hypothetical protein